MKTLAAIVVFAAVAVTLIVSIAFAQGAFAYTTTTTSGTQSSQQGAGGYGGGTSSSGSWGRGGMMGGDSHDHGDCCGMMGGGWCP